MVQTLNTAARAEGDDHVDVRVAEEVTADEEENAVQEEGTTSQNTSEKVSGKEFMSIGELQRMVHELYNIHIKPSKVKTTTPAAQKCCTAHGASSGEGVPRKESPKNSESATGAKRRLAMWRKSQKIKREFGVYPSHMAFKVYSASSR